MALGHHKQNSVNNETRMKICFVAHNAYPALANVRLDHVGGVERQQAMMANWLAARGHDVSMITWRSPSRTMPMTRIPGNGW